MSRQNTGHKRMYDDINPSFGLNKRVRSNPSVVPQTVRKPLAANRFDPGSNRQPNTFRLHEDYSLPGPNAINFTGPSLDSPYFNKRNQVMHTDRSYSPTVPTTDKFQKTITPTVQHSVPGPSKPKTRNSIHILTGTVDKVLLWSKMIRNYRVLFEVFGTCDYVRQGAYPCEKVFVMRDSNSSPTLQVVFYEIDHPLIPLEPGSVVKVQGSMTSRSRLQAFHVQKSSEEELDGSQRVFYICDRAAHDLIN